MMKYRSAGKRPHGFSRRLAGLLPVALLVPVMLISVGDAPAVGASSVGTVFGEACPDVMVIAARGSGEQPQLPDANSKSPFYGDWTDPAAYTHGDTFFGAGEANWDVYEGLVKAAPNLKISLDPVRYPADQAIDALNGSMYLFYKSEQSAVTVILNDFDSTERICGGGVKYVFTGYSQGAWAVHEALWQLAKRTPSVLGKVVGVSLFGDPLFIPFKPIVRDFKLTALGFGAATVLYGKYKDVPASLRPVTGSYCFSERPGYVGDPVCQTYIGLRLNTPGFGYCVAVNWAAGLCPHASYPDSAWGESAKAAAFLAPNLPPKTIWPHLTLSTPPQGKVNVAYSWKATVRPQPTAKIRYKWTALDPGALPLNLKFYTSGVLSGNPTQAGRYSFQIQATTPQGRYARGTVSVTINPDSSPGGPGAIRAGSISTGYDHSCAVTRGGGVKCWGRNSYGQLGNGTTNNSTTPVNVVGLGSGVAAVTAGFSHSCAVTTGGAVKCWGYNGTGELGNGSTVNSTTPVGVIGLGVDVTASAGNGYTCAVTTGGAVKCWGYNGTGELGNGSTVNSTTPVGVIGLGSGGATVSSGNNHTCAVATGAVKCWGNNGSGELGNGSTVNSTTPVGVVGLGSGVADVTAGNSSHSCAVTTAGAVKCWGDNSLGQLGNGTTTQSATPLDVVGLGSGVAAVTAGELHSCAVTTAGAVKCWGDNGLGQLGDGASANSYTPVDVVGLGSGVTGITAGGYDSCAVTTGGATKCWGDNFYGELGNGTTTYSTTPVGVVGLP